MNEQSSQANGNIRKFTKRTESLVGFVIFFGWLTIALCVLIADGAPPGSWLREFWWCWWIAFYAFPVVMYLIVERYCGTSPSTSDWEQDDLAASKTRENIKTIEGGLLIRALGRLMTQYPTALLGTEKLPAPKQKMKSVIKEAWRQNPESRAYLPGAYLHLSHFQDGIGDAILDLPMILDFRIPTDATSHANRVAFIAKMKDAIKELWRQNPKLSGLDIAKLSVSKFQDGIRDVQPDLPRIPNADDISWLARMAEMSERPNSPLNQWRAWEKVSMAEMEILMQEWEQFERSNGKTEVKRNKMTPQETVQNRTTCL